MHSFRKLFLDPVEIAWAQDASMLNNANVERNFFPSSHWDMSQEILRWTPDKKDVWTLEDALRGTQIFGSTGGGKSSGAGDKVARSFLLAGFGGLVLCVKEDEGNYWEKLCHQTGREKDLRRITLQSGIRYNFLDAEAKVGKDLLTLNISGLFSEIISLINRTPKMQQKDPFWTDVLMQTLNHAIVLQSAADDQISIQGLTQIINAAVARAKSESDTRPVPGKRRGGDPEQIFLKNLFFRARDNKRGDFEVELAEAYFTGEFAALAEKTRSIVVTTFTSMADAILRRPLKELLSTESDLKPEETFDGKIIVIDVPIHVYHRVGDIMNLVWKTAFKRACQRRQHLSPSRRPVFLWADEDHYLFDQVDAEYQTTARSALCCTVLLSQNLQNKFAKIGDRASVEALLGSLHNKIYHQNNENSTNEFAAEAIGKVPIEVKSESVGHDGKKSVTTSTIWDYDVPKRAFTNLKSGGPSNQFIVEGILHLPGRKFSNGKTWLKMNFKQPKKEGL